MKCNNKIIDVIRILSNLSGNLHAVTKGQIMIVAGEDSILCRAEGLKNVSDTLEKCAEMLQEAISDE